jgi:2-oxoglutarate dehydrogenase complex dehydrogenase (E1) component-like enzyme
VNSTPTVRIDEWAKLTGADVEIWQRNRTIRRGRVEMATSDSRMAWIMADGIETRTLVEKSQGHVIRISIRNAEMFSQSQVGHPGTIDVVLYTGG